MARPQTLQLAALNIVIHPHSPEKYVKLLQDAVRYRREAQRRHQFLTLRGDTKAIFRQVGRASTADDTIQGSIAKIVDIGPNDEWISLDTESVLPEDERPDITDDIKPYKAEFMYMLVPNIHRIIYECRHSDGSLSPRQAERIFDALFNDQRILREYGEVTVTTEQSSEGLKRIMELDRLSRIEIRLSRPNSDTGGDLDEAFEKLLDDANGRTAKLEVAAARSGPGLDGKNEVIQAAARTALSNGHVVAKGIDSTGAPIELSTADHPLIETKKFDPDKMSRRTAFRRFATTFGAILGTRRRRRDDQ